MILKALVKENLLTYIVGSPCGTGLPDIEKHCFKIINGNFIFQNYDIISRRILSEEKIYVIYKKIKCKNGIPFIEKMKKKKMTDENFLKSEYLKR